MDLLHPLNWEHLFTFLMDSIVLSPGVTSEKSRHVPGHQQKAVDRLQALFQDSKAKAGSLIRFRRRGDNVDVGVNRDGWSHQIVASTADAYAAENDCDNDSEEDSEDDDGFHEYCNEVQSENTHPSKRPTAKLKKKVSRIVYFLLLFNLGCKCPMNL
jgi:hypothetical protein